MVSKCGLRSTISHARGHRDLPLSTNLGLGLEGSAQIAVRTKEGTCDMA